MDRWGCKNRFTPRNFPSLPWFYKKNHHNYLHFGRTQREGGTMEARARTASHGLLALLLMGIGTVSADEAPSKKPGVAKASKNKAAPVAKLDAAGLTRQIDLQVQTRLDADGVKASARSDDAEF